jgi:predicted DNA-binding protein
MKRVTIPIKKDLDKRIEALKAKTGLQRSYIYYNALEMGVKEMEETL